MFDRHTTIDTVIGELTLVASDDALIGIYFPHHWVGADRATRGEAVAADTDPVLSQAADELRDYLAGKRTDFSIRTAAEGDDFQHRVWDLLTKIPFGETVSYGELAEQLGDRSLARMVGRAVGSNPLSIVIPCHRVVGKDGKLTGYAGGLERKRHLLELEDAPVVAGARLF